MCFLTSRLLLLHYLTISYICQKSRYATSVIKFFVISSHDIIYLLKQIIYQFKYVYFHKRSVFEFPHYFSDLSHCAVHDFLQGLKIPLYSPQRCSSREKGRIFKLRKKPCTANSFLYLIIYLPPVKPPKRKNFNIVLRGLK